MLERFTDNARDVVRVSFRRDSRAEEHEILSAIGARPSSLAARLLASAGVAANQFPADGAVIDRSTLVSRAIAEARSRGACHVGTEHLLLAVARAPASSLSRLGLAARLDDMISTAEAEWQRAHPPLARRLGSICRAAWHRLRGRSA